jgi:hypothetical protein
MLVSLVSESTDVFGPAPKNEANSTVLVFCICSSDHTILAFQVSFCEPLRYYPLQCGFEKLASLSPSLKLAPSFKRSGKRQPAANESN